MGKNALRIQETNNTNHPAKKKRISFKKPEETHYVCLRFALRAPLRLYSQQIAGGTGRAGGKQVGSTKVGLTAADLEICTAQVQQLSKRSSGGKRSPVWFKLVREYSPPTLVLDALKSPGRDSTRRQHCRPRGFMPPSHTKTAMTSISIRIASGLKSF